MVWIKLFVPPFIHRRLTSPTPWTCGRIVGWISFAPFAYSPKSSQKAALLGLPRCWILPPQWSHALCPTLKTIWGRDY